MPRKKPDEQTAELLRGYKIFDPPDMPTLRVLRLDTEHSNWFCLVSREILVQFANEMATQAQKIEPIQ